MDELELRKRGYYIENSFLTTPTVRYDLSNCFGAEVVDKSMHPFFKFLTFFALLGISVFFSVPGMTMPIGLGMLYLSYCWLASAHFSVNCLTPQGSHTIAEVKTPFYRFSSNEKEVADSIVSLIRKSL